MKPEIIYMVDAIEAIDEGERLADKPVSKGFFDLVQQLVEDEDKEGLYKLFTGAERRALEGAKRRVKALSGKRKYIYQTYKMRMEEQEYEKS